MLGLLSWRLGRSRSADAGDGPPSDMRSINIPSWVLYAMLSGGFRLMTLEFLRMLFRGQI